MQSESAYERCQSLAIKIDSTALRAKPWLAKDKTLARVYLQRWDRKTSPQKSGLDRGARALSRGYRTVGYLDWQDDQGFRLHCDHASDLKDPVIEQAFLVAQQHASIPAPALEKTGVVDVMQEALFLGHALTANALKWLFSRIGFRQERQR